ncbi:MAG TPA: hypothetical protein VNQ79_21535 [Blastocatellia bacterium]|nr:hypothetical protein [Blastocatellia bacterium]
MALTLAAVAVISATALRAQSQERSENGEQEAARQNFFTEPCDWLCRLRERQAQQLEGSWVHFPTPVLPPGTPPPPQRTTYLTFSRGGALIGSDRFEPFNSPQHGTWTHLGGNEFAWVAVADRFDTAGNFLGTFKARTKIILTGPDAFVGVSSVEFRDTAGNLVQARCATNRGERIRVEPLSEQCQNITPPR